MQKLTTIILFMGLALLPFRLYAQPAINQQDKATRIADANLNRDDGRTLYRQVVLVTCRFAAKEMQRVCQSRPIRKKIESLAIDVGPDLKDDISLGIINDPPSEKNMAFLQKDYDQAGRESDQWMYFPALKKLKRIVSQSDTSPKTGSVFGSEIAYEDMEKRHLSSYRYSYDIEEAYDGRQCDKITAYPNRRYQSKTSYSKEVMWIDQESKIALKTDLYDRQGRLVKTFFRKNLVCESGAWINKVLIVVNHLSRYMSMEKTTRLAVNIPIDEALVGLRALKDASFREAGMAPLRRQAK